MNLKPISYACLLAILATAGCSHISQNKPLKISTRQHSPVRKYVYDWPERSKKDRENGVGTILLLPPLGIEDPAQQHRFQEELYSAARRRFVSQLQTVMADSAYAPYVGASNLVRPDGSLDITEVAFLGALMDCNYVICPYARDFRPYHPQRIDIQMLVVNSGHAKVCAEFSGVLDAAERDTKDYFLEYSKTHKGRNESTDDLFFKLKSPAAFQAFVADMCATVMAEELSL